MSRITAFLLGTALTFLTSLATAVPLAENGQPAAEIVIPENPHPGLRHAAEELQLHVAMISGATLPIVHAPAGAKTTIILAVNPPAFAVDLAKIGATDGCAARRDGNVVTVFGSKPKGVLNGVYKLLTRNTDLVWARPDQDFGTIFTADKNLSLSNTDWVDVPVYLTRGWLIWYSDAKALADAELWSFRNLSNLSAAKFNYGPHTLKYGCVTEAFGGHNLNSLFIKPSKYFAEHPDFFPLIKGERLDPRSKRELAQLCFSNQAMTAAFLQEFKTLVEANPDYDIYRVIIEDNYHCCECPDCLKPIPLPDGAELPSTDPAFRSTQFFLWLQPMVDFLKQNHPGKRLATIAYFFTEIPPKVPVDPIINIIFCPIYKNSKLPLYAPGNEKTHDFFLGWMKQNASLNWREYYGLTGGAFPRPTDAVAIADWRYLNRFGVNLTYSEIYSDTKIYKQAPSFFADAWNLSAPYYWVLANASWNPYRDVEDYRRDFFTRVYGPAADDVAEFYATIEKSYLQTPGKAVWNTAVLPTWKQTVVEPGLIENCRAALKRAATRGLTGRRAKMLAVLRDSFEAVMTEIAAQPPVQPVLVGKAAVKPPFNPDFNSGEWSKAENIDKFFLHETATPARRQSYARVLYDQENIYIGLRSFYPEPEKMVYNRELHGRNEFPMHSEGFEIFLTHAKGDAGYYQFALDPANNRYSHEKAPTDWLSETKIMPDGWSAMVTVPWRLLGYDPNTIDQFKAAFVRLSKDPGDSRHYYFPMLSTRSHALGTFNPMRLGK